MHVRRFSPSAVFAAAFSVWLAACFGSSAPTRSPEVDAKDASAASPMADDSEEKAEVPISPDDATRGSRQAYVTFVVFADFQCPYCAKLAKTIEHLRETYGDETLRVVFKNNPLGGHEHARLAAEAGQGVLALGGPDAFWRYHDVIFRRQGAMSPEMIRQWAFASGASPEALEAGLASGRWASKVDRDEKLADIVGADGAPASFVNGIYVGGAKPEPVLREIIDGELEKAKTLERQGMKRSRIYVARTSDNFATEAARAAEEEQRRRADELAATRTVHKIPLGSSPARGPKTALVTIVEFSDFECPYCKKVEPTLDRIRSTYGDKVRIVWKDAPLAFHARAEPAAELARAGRAQRGEDGFWAVHDRLLESSSLDDAALERIAGEAKLDVAKAMAAVRAKSFKRAIDEDIDTGDDFDAAGTPHFFVNGRRVVGAKSFDLFKAVIDEEIARAQEMLASGVAPERLYDERIKDGAGTRPFDKMTIAAPASSAPFRGPADAKIVIQEVGDFECPFCARADKTLGQISEHYKGRVKIVWRDKPLSMHVHAPLAAEAAREAFAQKGSEGFSRMQKLLFDNQRRLERTDLDDYARAIGLDMTKFAAALDGRVHKSAVDADAKAADDATVSGTPAFFIGPYHVSGARSFVRFRKIVDRVLEEESARGKAQPRPKTQP